jgi:hypothetical protein
VRADLAGNIAKHRACCFIDRLRMSAPGDEEAMMRSIHRDVVPTALAADMECV